MPHHRAKAGSRRLRFALAHQQGRSKPPIFSLARARWDIQDGSLREHGGMSACPYAHAQAAQPPDEAAQDRPRQTARAQAEAHDFLRQFYAETGRAGLEARLREWELDPTLTHEELTFGARVAWRGSARCVGRLPWASLRVRDRRHVTAPDEVFSELVAHLRGAWNGGRIRPTMTVFGPGVRIVNDQLIRYAEYTQPDGSVVGDPQNAALTAYLLRLGWAGGPGTRFDVLPLCVTVNGQPHLFEWPADAVQEVHITHPEHPGIGELGLRWHALPVISNMTLDVAGQKFHAAPFNGWYLETEIAARNLADQNRYDQLPAVARALGLDTTRRRSLWMDRALVELNVATLHSFDAAGVRISDHHGVTAQFAQFARQEAGAGRVVRGEWSWLIPPVSPATTPVWAAKFDPQEVPPRFRRQRRAWLDIPA